MIKLLSKTGITVAALGLALAGCASNNDRYPSLAIREFEKVQGTFEVAGEEARIEPPAPANVADISQAVKLVDEARLVHQSFLEFAPGARQRINAAHGLDPGENAWAEGQIAYAELAVKRGEVATLLSDLDMLFAEASASYRELAEIDAAREIIRQLVAEEDSILNQLTDSK